MSAKGDRFKGTRRCCAKLTCPYLLLVSLTLTFGTRRLFITMTNNPSTDDFFPQRDEEVSVYRATIIFAKPPPVLPSYGSRVPVSLRVEGDVREYVDNELHERLVSGTGKRAWRRQELSVKAVSQGPDMQSWVIDARHKGDYCDEWEPDLSVIFDAQGLGQEKPDTVWKDAYRTDSRVSAHGLLTVSLALIWLVGAKIVTDASVGTP
jgi:hypothetical protein